MAQMILAGLETIEPVSHFEEFETPVSQVKSQP
jgi:hypothetical protein